LRIVQTLEAVDESVPHSGIVRRKHRYESNPAALSASGRLVETLVITAALPAAGYALQNPDPFLLQASFPWLVFAPLLVGVQHGLSLGILSAVLSLLGAWAHSDLGIWLGATAPGSSTLGESPFQALAPWGTGCLLAAIVAGHFRDRWEKTGTALVVEHAELARRLRRTDSAHAVLRLSHARLEERLAAQAWSLDSCLRDATRQLEDLTSFADLGRVVLDVLASQAMVQSASLFVPAARARRAGAAGRQPSWLGARRGPILDRSPLATLGNEPSPRSTHPLVKSAWATRRLQAVTGAPEDAGLDPSVLAAVPLLTSEGQLLGVIAIHDMPFLAFQSDNLTTLARLTSHLADVIEQRLIDAAESRSSFETEAADPEFTLTRKKSGLFRIQAPSAPSATTWQSQSRKTRS
jgi:hypothetical protein